jgi:drug/metabolite transporter (DMT)-like permease
MNMEATGGTATEPAARQRSGAVAWFINPYVQIGIGAILVTASEVLLKKGADNAAHLRWLPDWLAGIGALASGWTWAGIVLYILSFVSWLHVLRFVSLTIAFSLINAVHVLVPVASWLVLKEHVPVGRWVGIGLILSGIIMVVGPVAKIEEKL